MFWKYLKKLSKAVILFFIGKLALLIIIPILLYIPSIQNFIAAKAAQWISKKTHTNISLEKINIKFPLTIVLTNLKITNNDNSPIVHANKISCLINPLPLLYNTISVPRLDISNTNITLKHNKDNLWNYTPIISAFTTKNNKKKVSKKHFSFNVSASNINLKNINFNYDDTIEGTQLKLKLTSLKTGIETDKGTKLHFLINKPIIDGLDFKYLQTKIDNNTSPSDNINDYISINDVLITNSKIIYKDSTPGSFNLYIDIKKSLYVKANNINISENIFDLDKLNANNMILKIILNEVSANEQYNYNGAPETAKDLLYIKIGHSNIKNANISYINKQTKIEDGFDYNNLILHNLNLDASKFYLNVKKDSDIPVIKANFKQLSFNETHSRLLINDFKANFIFNNERLELTNLLIKTPNTTIKNKIKILWPNLSNIDNNIKNLFIDASLVNSKIYISDILKFAPNLRSNDIIKSLTNETIYINTKFKGKAKDLSIDSADISIDKNFYASIRGRGLNLTNSSKMIVDLAIHKLHISSNKLITILSKYTNINKFKSILKQAKFINVKGKIKGTLTKLNMDLSTNTAILNASTTGYINLDSKNYLDIKTNITTQNSNLILNALNTKGIQDQYKIPKKLRIKAHIKGTLNNFYTTTELISNQGSIALTGNIKKRSGIFYYNTDVNINKLDIGYFLMDKDLIGKATGTLNIQGHSFDYKYIQANFKANFKNLQLKNYNYNDISINGSINKKLIRLTADINDPNLQAHIDTATINNRNQNLSVKGDINLYYANLKNLDIVKDDLIISSHLKVDFPTLNKENINGQLLVTDFIFARDTGSDIIDSVKIDAHSQGLSKQFSIESEFLNAQLTGKFKISQIGNSIKYVLATHLNNIINYSIPGPEDQSFKLDVQIHKARAISLLIPKLEDFQDANINAELHTLDRMLTLNVNLPLIEYGDISVNKLSIKANINPTEAKYNTYVEQLKYNDNSLNKLALDGTLDNNILKNSFIILNDNKQEDYSIKFDAAIANNQVDIHFHPDIILDKYQWHIKNDNKIILNKSKIAIHNFELSNQKSMLKIANTNDLINDQLEISFKDFNIKTISKIVREEKNGELISGIINGNLTINSLKNNPTFSSNIKIESLNIKNQLLGNLNLQAQEAEKIIDVKAYLDGNNNDVNIVGNYNTKDQTIDFNIQIKKINLDAVEKLSNQEIQDLSGDLSAAININGTISNPEIKGAISFQNMSFKIRYLNTAFIIQDEKLNIGETINIENFNILDTEKNKATINGSITLLKDFSDILAELTINTDNFKIFGNQNLKGQKELFYGPVYITSNTKLNKTKQATNIKSKVWIAEKTSLNIIMPNKTANIDNREGIVIFKSQHLEKKQDLMEERLHKEHQKTAKKSQKKLKLNIDATINISEASDLRIILDKNGDELVAKGEATLTMSMQNSSDPIITGRYIISEGYYKLSIQDFLTKKFVLEKDGFIAWGGKVENADLNISAKHTVNAAPLPLVNGMTQNLSDEERNKFREKLPFEIQINIVGKLLQPTISFKLDLDDSAKTKDAGTTTEIRLKQINIRESELNKQVISLLAFKRFMEDDPFDSLNNMDADLDIKARNTLGNVLTNQLNDLAGNAIKGIGINFGFNSKKSYETGFADTQSNLDINVKKQLFNNRLTITVGKSLALEGKDMQTKNANNLINNLSLEYALSRNRHYRILFYTTTLDYNPLQTDVRETGLNFVMYRNYNRLKHLFRKPKKETKTNKNKKNQTNDTKPK